MDFAYKQVKTPYAKTSLTFIVVGKRHHMRFIPPSRAEADKSGNVHAGLVVDSDITSPAIFDFYLQSHAGLKGST